MQNKENILFLDNLLEQESTFGNRSNNLNGLQVCFDICKEREQKRVLKLNNQNPCHSPLCSVRPYVSLLGITAFHTTVIDRQGIP